MNTVPMPMRLPHPAIALCICSVMSCASPWPGGLHGEAGSLDSAFHPPLLPPRSELHGERVVCVRMCE
jgi:hypothetical protein